MFFILPSVFSDASAVGLEAADSGLSEVSMFLELSRLSAMSIKMGAELSISDEVWFVGKFKIIVDITPERSNSTAWLSWTSVPDGLIVRSGGGPCGASIRSEGRGAACSD